MVNRVIPTITTDPGGVNGTEFSNEASDSVAALWALNGGMATSVSGTNALTMSVGVSTGFSAYTDGLEISFVAANTNTGAMTINVSSVGTVSLLNNDGDATSAGEVVGGRLTTVKFFETDNAFRLQTSGGTTNVTVSGGLTLQLSDPARLVADAGPTTSETSVLSKSFQCGYSTSRTIISGAVSFFTAAGTSVADGITLKLYVDSVDTETVTDYCMGDAKQTFPFHFSYSSGDTSAHTYEIKVTSSLNATYKKSASFIVCSEVSQNV